MTNDKTPTVNPLTDLLQVLQDHGLMRRSNPEYISLQDIDHLGDVFKTVDMLAAEGIYTPEDLNERLNQADRADELQERINGALTFLE